jgi:hypothetical protein
MRIDFLIDHPLFSRMIHAKISSLRPNGQMVDLVEPFLIELIERVSFEEIARFGGCFDDSMPFCF